MGGDRISEMKTIPANPKTVGIIKKEKNPLPVGLFCLKKLLVAEFLEREREKNRFGCSARG